MQPHDAAHHVDLGNSLRAKARFAEAEASYRRALALDPNSAAICNNLGAALKDRGKLDEAIDSYRQAIALDPNLASAHFNLGFALHRQSKSREAAESYRRAVAANPNLASAYMGLAHVLQSQGQPGEASAYYRRALELAPGIPAFHSFLLFCLQYDPAMTPGALLVEHRAFGASLPPAATGHTNPRDPDKRLNIGYIAPDLYAHPVGFMLMPVVAEHDRAKFAVHCYYGNPRVDGVTVFLKEHVENWRSTVGVDDAALAEMIRADGIDILVDLTGHTADNRLPVFARKPAPVQVSWAGYVGTTGLKAIDYLITDRWHSPPGSERYAVEKLVRLPDGYACWAMPSHAPAVGPLSAITPGAVTFGCFNNLTKVNPLVVALWSRLLRELPRSRLVLKTFALGDATVQARIMTLFAAEDISPDRIVLEGASPHLGLLQRYNDIDIALDPFPYSGGLTTMEALWMGVPVVTMPGERFASRHSFSHLSNAGLDELVADGPETYLRIARELAHDLPRLAALRAGMRERLNASPLRRSKDYTRGYEAALRKMWKCWCDS